MKILLPFLVITSLFSQSYPDSVYVPYIAKDNIQTSLSAPMAPSDNVAIVASSTGWVPNMLAYICDSSTSTTKCTGTFEVMNVTAVNGNVLTVLRAQGGTTAVAHASGKFISNLPVALYNTSVTNEVKALEKFAGSSKAVDLRYYGAVCDGVTNVQPAVTAAMAAGYRRLFLPANCIWNPTSNTLPDGIYVIGEDFLTSKIWAVNPLTTFINQGKQSTLQNVNLNGPGCFSNYASTIGCPAYLQTNSDPNNIVPIQNPPFSITMDVGDSLPGGPDPHDMNAITVIERGQGGGIYGQYNGGIAASSGTGIQAAQAAPDTCTGCAGLRSSKFNSGPGFVMDEGVNGPTDGGTGVDALYTSSIKRAGDIWEFFQSTSAWAGNMFQAQLGFGGGTLFTGNFENYNANGVQQWYLDYLGNYYHSGYEAMRVGSNVTSASSITPTAPMFHVTGTTQILTINVPTGLNTVAHCMTLIPDAAFTTNTGGNISVATTAVAGKAMRMCYEPGAAKYYPSY